MTTWNLNESNAALRVIRARIFDNTAAPLSLGHVFAPGDLKIIAPDNTIVNASALPVAVSGAAAGTFDIQVSQTEISAEVGDYRWQLAGAAYTFQEWIRSVRLPMQALAVLTSIIEGAAQVDGGGEMGGENVTLVQALREILAYCSGNASGLDGTTPQYMSRGGGAPASGSRNRIVGNLVNGNRTVTSRDNT